MSQDDRDPPEPSDKKQHVVLHYTINGVQLGKRPKTMRSPRWLRVKNTPPIGVDQRLEIINGRIHKAIQEAMEIDENTSKSRRADEALTRLIRLADLCPLTLRKELKAMAGDYDAERRRLHAEGRPWAAKWNVALAWIIAARLTLTAPASWILNILVKAVKG